MDKTMKHTKTLFFLFALLVFQQTQVDAKTLLNRDNLFPDQSPQAAGLPTTVLVYMKEFTVDGDPTNNLCTLGSTTLGCVEQVDGLTLTYPPSNQYITFPNGGVNPMLVDVENYYLPNVLPREMDVVTNYPTLEALQAQALAARTIGDWKFRANSGYINNSTQFQIFVPDAYNYYLNHQDPITVQNMISTAVSSTSGQYLSYNGESIDAEFGSDMQYETIDEPVQFPKHYLNGVDDPISTDCDYVDVGNNQFGMSQKGAIRWSLGNQCAAGGDASTKWSVKWTDYRQILAHYYTGIDILNGSSNPVAPDDRWNLLWHDVPIPNGASYSIQKQRSKA